MADISPTLSTAAATATGGGQRVTRADLTPPGPAPNRIIDDFRGLQAPSSSSYPADTPVYYTSLGINDYQRTSWDAVGTLSVTDSIALPLPALIVDDQVVTYEALALGALGALAVGGASPLVQQGLAGIPAAVKNALGGASNVSPGALGAIISTAVRATSATALGGATQGVLAAAGVSVNEFLTIMLRGPSYKERDLAWRFSPKTPDESRRINRIAIMIKNAQAPSLGAGGIFFSWPKIFQIKFRHVQEVDMGIRLFDFKPCVLTSAIFNYTPAGAPSFYGSTSYPEGLEMRLKFIELEYWVHQSGRQAYRDEGSETSTGTATDRVLGGFDQFGPTKP